MRFTRVLCGLYAHIFGVVYAYHAYHAYEFITAWRLEAAGSIIIDRIDFHGVLDISKLTNIPSSRSAWKKENRKMCRSAIPDVFESCDVILFGVKESDIHYGWHDHTWPRLRDNNLDKYIEMDDGIDDYFAMVFLAIQTYYKRHFTFMRATPANLPNHFNHCRDSVVGIVSASAC